MRIFLDDDHRLTVTDLHREMMVSFMHVVCCGTIEHALKELEMHKVCARWVLCELVLDMREQRVVAVQTFLTHYKNDGTVLREWVVTGDEL